MKKFKIKSGDNVQIIAGDHKGQKGVVLSIDKIKDRVIVEGVNLKTKHEKPSSNKPQGGISKKEAPIHISNVSLLDPKSSEPARVTFEIKDGKKVRISKKSKEVI